jgi:protein-disulfide isomerase
MTKKNPRQPSKSKRSQAPKNNRTPLLVLLAASLLLAAFLLIYPRIQPVEQVQFTPRAYPQADGVALGDRDATVLVEAWEDFQCLDCRQYSQDTEPRLIQDYVQTGKVRYVFHHFPYVDNTASTQESHQAANASMCASDQGRFWEYHEILFANLNVANAGDFSDRRLVAFAKALGLDLDAFQSCFKENRHQKEIERDFTRAGHLGVLTAPAIFVNKLLVTNSQGADLTPSYDDISRAIEEALAPTTQP